MHHIGYTHPFRILPNLLKEWIEGELIYVNVYTNTGGKHTLNYKGNEIALDTIPDSIKNMHLNILNA